MALTMARVKSGPDPLVLPPRNAWGKGIYSSPFTSNRLCPQLLGICVTTVSSAADFRGELRYEVEVWIFGE